MPRYIDTERLDEVVQDFNENHDIGITRYEYKRISAVLWEFPTANVVEVVRCKDCEWWKLSEYNTFGIHVCKKFSGVRGEHDFCSRGERMKGEEDEPLGVWVAIDSGEWQVECDRCGAKTGWFAEREDAIEEWNRRVEDD